MIFNLRLDPFELAEFNSNVYWDWMMNHIPHVVRDAGVRGGADREFAKFPPRQKPASFNLDAVLQQVQHASGVAKAKAVAGKA